MNQRTMLFVLFLLACTTLPSCGSSMGSPPIIAPSISSISPSSMPAGSGQFNLLLTGQGLSTASVVHFGSDLPTPVTCSSNSSCNAIVVPVPAKDVTTSGPVNVSVSNSSLSSNTIVFTVTPQPTPANTPKILTFLPMIAPAGGSSFTMIVVGLNVAPGAVVNFGSLQLTPTSIVTCNPGQLCPEIVDVPASAIASAGTISLSLMNSGTNGGTSSAVPFLVIGKNTFPIEESVSNANPPAPANGNSMHSSVSGGAAFVAFDSSATNLVAGATSGFSQVYLRNNCFAGVPNCVPQTILISAAPDGSTGAGGMHGSDKPVISLDGRFVAFESDDTNLVSGVTQPVEEIYLRDTCSTILGPVAGCTPSTTLVSSSSAGAPGNAPSSNPTISGFGLFVAFQSTATNLVGTAAPAGVSQVYLRQQCPSVPVLGAIPGCVPSLTLASLDANGNAGDKDSVNASLDVTGFALSFESLADNIVAGTPGNGFEQIYARDNCLLLTLPGVPLTCPNVSAAVSVDSSGKLGTGDSVSPATDIGALVVAFATRAPNILPANTASQQVVARTTCILEDSVLVGCTPGQTLVVSVDQNGVPGQADSSNPAIGGRKIGFTSLASLLPNVSGRQVYEADPCLLVQGSCTPNVVLVSADANGKPIGGDFATLEGAGAFATFSTTGSSASPGISEIFLGTPFF